MLKVLRRHCVVVIVRVRRAWAWVSLHWVYADGERAGYVQKFSRTRLACARPGRARWRW